jgi:hypothetical protein
MLFFWYCFDDYLARVCHNPDLGTVPWWVILLLNFVFLPMLSYVFGRRAN